ncbi:hypothetical protein DCW30_10030 [Streptomyces alfalfae]|uniref:ATP-binding protein n=1 Tax=Streptomyces alfalfae TaxID=1642299 RepID=A0A1P8THX0_9ACTN|nr:MULTISPECIES: hypothetical protein [Streptomyces]AYA17596.1 hypothetical protein D3X13_16280 [Streptomyces fradiae]APY87195.1 hypothetical protein A7J05_16945 [Streptomyces alfalfae]KUL55083.1 hypothetical protein ADL30_14685 [Streptomyces sp. NRRL S-1521]QQC90511.1 hypothetical protein I8755_20440 [Streptomyces alfalfae]QUI32990.1 hypothetical protein H9W91_20625 [Streptomyces alfalfae]
MKAMKAAAVLAGSLAIAGSAAVPAFAGAQAPSGPNGGLDDLASKGLEAATPVGTNMLNPKNSDSVANTVKGVVRGLSSEGPGKLIGGLPAGK